MDDKMPRTASSQAMQSLFSAYDEDGQMEDDKISGSEDEDAAVKNISPESVAEERETAPPVPVKKQRMMKRVTKLVSYGADEDANEDENEDEMEEEFDDEKELTPPPSSLVDYDISYIHPEPTEPVEEPCITLPSGEEVRLPPEPTGKCSRHLQQKITSYYEKMMRTGKNLNNSIQQRKDFRNPSIYEKLIHFVDLDEKGTNYPPTLFDPSLFGAESLYDNLAKVQKEEMDKREKEKKEKTKVEFVTGTKKSDEAKSRRSKWDAQPQGTSKPVISAAGIATNPQIATVTTVPSGTKSTVIPSAGSLKKQK